jgi:broad specificity phosphatase PhoE
MGLTLKSLIDPTNSIIFSSPLGRARQTAEIIAEAATVSGEIAFDPISWKFVWTLGMALPK